LLHGDSLVHVYTVKMSIDAIKQGAQAHLYDEKDCRRIARLVVGRLMW